MKGEANKKALPTWRTAAGDCRPHLIPFWIKVVVNNFGLLLLSCKQQKEKRGKREREEVGSGLHPSEQIVNRPTQHHTAKYM